MSNDMHSVMPERSNMKSYCYFGYNQQTPFKNSSNGWVNYCYSSKGMTIVSYVLCAPN